MEQTRLIQARMHKHWTQSQAAEHLGIDVTTLNRWERGKATPHAYNVQQLCDVYGVSAYELSLSGESVEQEPHPDLHIMVGPDLTMRLLAIAFGPQRQYQVIQNKMITILEEGTMNEDITRREALRRVATLPLLTLGLNVSAPVIRHPPEEILAQCAAGITACWELSKGDDESDLALAFKGASAYLPTLKVIVANSAKCRKDAASLAGQCALLQCLLGWHLQGLKEAIAYAQDAVTYSKEANDIPLLLSTLDYLAWAYYYDRKGKSALKVINQALPFLKMAKVPLSPHLQGGIYSTLALMQARNGEMGTEALHQAAEAFFAQPETDNRFVFMDYTRADLVLNDGMVHYHQGDYGKALDSLGQLIDPETLAVKLPLPERSRVEGLNTMALASLKYARRDMEQVIHIWKRGITEATKLKSEQRFSEALLAYDIAQAVWPGEKRVTELRDLVTHW